MPSRCSSGSGRRAPSLRILLLAALAAGSAACSGNPRSPAAPPPRTVGDPVAASEAPAPPPAVAPAPAAEPRPPEPRVVIEPAEPEAEEQPTLAEAARRERERRRRQTGQPIAVINDANLQEHAVGQLTFMEDVEESEGEEGGAEAAAGEGPDEQYWRDRVRGIRERWAAATAQVPELEARVAELRRRFYEVDDAYYRDSRIKPAWDRAIDLIAQARAEAEAHRTELEEALEEGRLAGALPGWLREGIELEPAPEEPDGPIHEPGEPQIVEPGEAGGDG